MRFRLKGMFTPKGPPRKPDRHLLCKLSPPLRTTLAVSRIRDPLPLLRDTKHIISFYRNSNTGKTTSLY